MLLKAGDMIVLPPLQSLDEKLFDSPMEVDFFRPLAPNMTFGSGVHFCPGTFLASTELELFLCEWLDQIPEFRLQAHSQPKMSSGILGAMLELRRVPGSVIFRPSGLSSTSPRELFNQQPVPGGMTPEP